MSLLELTNELVEKQLLEWQLVHDNYATLNDMLIRELWLQDNCSRIILQYNPSRVRSTAADLSSEAIKARPCFLCDANQPAEQEAVLWKSSRQSRWYKIQVNPYPIFKRHLTISTVEHRPQECFSVDMMELAQQLPGHVIMFNGDGCGASAPDHMHFQATMQDEMPLCRELELRKENVIKSGHDTDKLWMDNHSGRQLIYIRAESIDSNIIYDMNLALTGWKQNVLCWFKNGVWHYVVFPRTHGRPACYGNGEGQFLVSPASAEFGGVWVLPRKEDFERINADFISAIYKELTCSEYEMSCIYDFYVKTNC